jgi:hypothetical protein
MTDYKINRWDAVILKTQTQPQPMVYITLNDNSLLGKVVQVTISGTNSDYDNIKVDGLIQSSAYFPNYRPEFFKETGYSVVALAYDWNGYPSNNGTITIFGGESNPAPVNESPKAKTKDIKHQIEKYKETKIDTTYHNAFIIILFIFTLSLAFLYLQKGRFP